MKWHFNIELKMKCRKFQEHRTTNKIWQEKNSLNQIGNAEFQRWNQTERFERKNFFNQIWNDRKFSLYEIEENKTTFDKEKKFIELKMKWKKRENAGEFEKTKQRYFNRENLLSSKRCVDRDLMEKSVVIFVLIFSLWERSLVFVNCSFCWCVCFRERIFFYKRVSL